MNPDRTEFYDHVKKFNKIVIWGLRTRYHTHRYIHQGFYQNLKKLEARVVWVNAEQKNSDVIEKGDFVMTANPKGKMINGFYLPVKEGVYYCLHNLDDQTGLADKINPAFLLNLQVYTDEAKKSDQKWDEVTYLNTKIRTLYQPWGTNLLEEEFKRPFFNNHKRVFWIGSVWNNALNQGNVNEIGELKQALSLHGLKFVQLQFVPDIAGIFLIRQSRLAPAIAGAWQTENNYLPCRMFKNISYGQLGFSNVRKFDDLFVDCNLQAPTILALVDKALELKEPEYKDLVLRQQEVVKKHTYLQKLNNMFKALEILNSK